MNTSYFPVVKRMLVNVEEEQQAPQMQIIRVVTVKQPEAPQIIPVSRGNFAPVAPEDNARDAHLWRLKQAEDLIREVARWEAEQSKLQQGHTTTDPAERQADTATRNLSRS